MTIALHCWFSALDMAGVVSSAGRLIPTLQRMPASDVRDWPVIRAWAADLAVHLQAIGSATQAEGRTIF